jgi:hypothetical protein
MRASVRYTWWAQRRGFLRNTLKEGACDVVLGLPTGIDLALTTRPYYRSTYVFVSRADRGLDIRSFDDPRLKSLKVGVQLIGDDYANSPSGARALAPRHRGQRRRVHRVRRLRAAEPAGAHRRSGRVRSRRRRPSSGGRSPDISRAARACRWRSLP